MQIVGAVICALVCIRLLQSIASAVQSASIRSASAAASRVLLDERIAAAQARRRTRDRQELQWNGYRKFRVARKVDEAVGTVSLYLQPHDGKRLPSYRPGQFLTFRFSVPGKSKPAVRCYSLSDAPHDDCFRVTVKRVPPPTGSEHPPGRISNFVHDGIEEGALLDVQAPRGDFCLDPSDTNPVVLIGGGVGVTPVLSMLNAITEAGTNRPVWFFYALRNGREHVMRDHLQQLADFHDNVHLTVIYSRPDSSDKRGEHFDHQGHLNAELIQKVVGVPNYDFYICGPPPMMESLVPQLEKWGVAKEQIHTEAFGPAAARPAQKPRTTNATASATDSPSATVKFIRSGRNVTWNATAGSLLDVALENGVEIDSGCRAGSCGTCVVKVREGRTETTIDGATDCDEGTCLACVSIPVGNVVIDA